ncbi:MAG TPA: Pr6Pr family membrane protein [Candidatus Dormibacteraeota bacterium]|nr:Pr6Pr family membrane protein [Candidatus Dormibacteraeota bacterium]
MRTRVLAGYRLVVSALGFGSIGVKLIAGAGEPHFDAVNFLSFFTHLSVLFAAGILLYCALSRHHSPAIDNLRGAAVTYVAITGMVYNTILGGAGDLGSAFGIADSLAHKLIPILVAIDWIVDPPGNRLALRLLPLWLAFPIGFAVYSMLRGAAVGWYPYGFFNPDAVGGYGGVATWVAGISVGTLVIALLVVAVGNVGRRVRSVRT